MDDLRSEIAEMREWANGEGCFNDGPDGEPLPCVYYSQQSFLKLCDRLEAAQALQAAPEGWVLVPVGRGQDERVNDDSYRALIHGFRSLIGARRPGDRDPEDQWAWDKATDLLTLLLSAAPSPSAALQAGEV